MQSVREQTIPIFHMASMARSGETLLLRCLDAHPEILVVSQLFETTPKEQRDLFELLTTRAETRIPRTEPAVVTAGAAEAGSLLIKQGTWEHRFPFEGFVLARNPLSIFQSLLNYDQDPRSARAIARGVTNRSRLERWTAAIDPELAASLADLDELEAFAAFYNRRMQGLARTGLPVLCFERFVTAPEAGLRALLGHLNRPYDPACLQSHRRHDAGSLGHGRIALDSPISTDVNEKYRALDPEAQTRLAALTEPVWSAFGYRIETGASGADVQPPDDLFRQP